MRNHLAAALLLLALCAPAAAARADDVDVVVLQSGVSLRGIVISDDDKGVTIQTLDGDTQTIARKDVKSISYAKGSPATPPPPPPDNPPPPPPPPKPKADEPPPDDDDAGEETGRVDITGFEPGNVTIDGGEPQRLEDEPLHLDLPKGRHTVLVEFDGGTSETRNIRVVPGRSVLVAFKEPSSQAGVADKRGWKTGLVSQLGLGTAGFLILPIQAGLAVNRGMGRYADFQLDLEGNFTWTGEGATLGGLAVIPGFLFHIGGYYTMSARVPLDLLFTAGGRFSFFSDSDATGIDISESSFGNPTFRMNALLSPAGVQFGAKRQHHIELSAGPGFFLYDHRSESFREKHTLVTGPELQFEFTTGLRYSVLFL